MPELMTYAFGAFGACAACFAPLALTVREAGGIMGLALGTADGKHRMPRLARALRRLLHGVYIKMVNDAIASGGDDTMVHKTAAEEGLYLASTPNACNDAAVKELTASDAKAVTAANWFFAPWNRLGYRHMDKLVTCVPVAKGAGAAVDLPPASAADIAVFESVRLPGGVDLDTMLARMNVDGFLVLRGGTVVAERYRNGQASSDRHIMFSVTKGWTGLLAELLIHEGRLDESRLVTAYLPQLIGTAVDGATVRQLLDMEVAVNWDEAYPDVSTSSDLCRFLYAASWVPFPDSYPAEERRRLRSMRAFEGTLASGGRHALQLEHGCGFHYATVLTDVLGEVIVAIEGAPLHEAFSRRVYSRVGAEQGALLAADCEGVGLAGSGLTATLRDMGRLGAMLAARGAWNGEQVVPRAVVDRLLRGGNKAHLLAPAVVGDAGVTKSYTSQWYTNGNHLHGFGIHGQHNGIYPNSGLVVITQASNKASDGGVAMIFSQTVGEQLDAAFVAAAK